MATRKWADLSEDEKKWAQEQYYNYQSNSAIARELNIPRTTLSYHTQKWNTDREMRKAELYQKFSASKKTHFINMSEDIIKIISKSLSHLASRSAPPTTREAKEATVILESLDKITRLDDNAPTEIVGEKVVELKDIQTIAEMIPFKIVNEKEEEEDEEVN